MNKKTEFNTGRQIPALYDPERIGATLKEIAIDVIEADGASLTSRWFHSTNDVDLFIWSDEKQRTIKAQINCCGQVVEWSAYHGVRTGLIIETENVAKEVTETIEFDAAMVQSVVDQAISILQNVADLSADDREKLLDLMRRGPDRSHRAPQIEKFTQDFAREKPDSFIKRIRRWFSGSSAA